MTLSGGITAEVGFEPVAYLGQMGHRRQLLGHD
jgi:hypothetical protein